MNFYLCEKILLQYYFFLIKKIWPKKPYRGGIFGRHALVARVAHNKVNQGKNGFIK